MSAQVSSEEQLKADFRKFLWVIWRHLKLSAPTPLQYDIALYLSRGPKRRMVQAFRGGGKSWITAALVLWYLYRDSQARIMVVSANEKRAIAFATFVRRLIEEIEILHHLRPKDGQRDNALEFDVGPAEADQSPSLKAVGITGQLTGSRATHIVADDIEVPKNSATEQMREKLAELIKEFDAVIKPGGEIIYLGTPQTYHSIYRQLSERGYDIRIWPARFPANQEMYDGKLAPFISSQIPLGVPVGSPTEPERFTDLDLAEREASYGRSGFALQFMLDTSLSDANKYPLKTSDLIVFDCDLEVAPSRLTWASGEQQIAKELANVGFPGDRFHRPLYTAQEMVKYEGAVMVIDPSGRGADETAFAVTKLLHGMVFLTRAGGLQGGYDNVVLEALAHIAKNQKVNLILIESNFGDGMFKALFEPVLNRIYPCSVEEYKVAGQKERRIIDKLEPVMNSHRLIIDKSIIEANLKDDLKFNLLYQLTHLTRDRGALRHDDRVDALAEAVGYWTEKLARDTKTAEDAHRDRLREQEFKNFMENCLGRASKKQTYHRVASVLRRR